MSFVDGVSVEALLLQSEAAHLLLQHNNNNNSSSSSSAIVEAIKKFEAAMNLDKQSAIITIGNSHELFDQKKFAECVEVCDIEISALDERRKQIEAARAEATKRLDANRAQQKAAQQRAIQQMKDSGKEFALNKKFAEAVDVYECWCRLEPMNPTPRSHISFIYEKTKKWDLCIQHCSSAIELCEKALLSNNNNENGAAADSTNNTETNENQDQNNTNNGKELAVLLEKLQKRKADATAAKLKE
jgi:hypothetical protein